MINNSDVRIIVSNNGYRELDEYVKKYVREHNLSRTWNYMKRPHFIKEGNNQTYIGWNDLKWYENCNFVPVDSSMSGLEYLKENGYSFRYSRIEIGTNIYDEKYYDSETEKGLMYPYVFHEFNDDYIYEKIDNETSLNEEDFEL